MKRSSARQQEFDFQSAETSAATEQSTLESEAAASTSEMATTATSPVSFPNFGNDYLYALTARRAGRLNAASIPQREVEELLRERQMLLDKHFAGTIDRKETIRLTYVRWSLARVEDARHGEALDRLESWITEYERFGGKLESLMKDLSQHVKAGRK